MTEHDAARREFLVRAVVSAGAVAGAGLAPACRRTDATSTTREAGGDCPRPIRREQAARLFSIFMEDAPTIAAFTERLMPGAPGKTGRAECGRAQLHRPGARRRVCRPSGFLPQRGSLQLDGYCRKSYKEPFARLSGAQQDEVLQAMEQGEKRFRVFVAGFSAGIF